MKLGFYPKLAWDGIRKNKRLYFPYILTGCVMVMMYYILSYLIESPSLAQMPGGSILRTILPLGCAVIAAFSILFLFYTNSFLIKQRYREFGLYNILGMDKKNIGHILVWESVFVAFFAIAAGLLAGIALSKAAELALLNLLNMEVSFDLSVGLISLRQTPQIYGCIYLLLLLYSLLRVSFSKPLELMENSRVGERVPKRTWLFALTGVALLAIAYCLALSIQEPLTALLLFFVAVLMVILGTYLLLISGSVAFCKLLQGNKRYYYQPSHFVSVSSMVYRMKRNGAGLASICILLTMVLVMISSTTSLYFGAEDSLQNRYPSGVNISVTYREAAGIGDDSLDPLRSQLRAYTGDDLTGIRSCQLPGMITAKGLVINVASAADLSFASYDNIGYLSAISLNDYNHMMGTPQTLADNECLIYCDRLNLRWDRFAIEQGGEYTVKAQLTDFPMSGDALASVMPTLYMVVKDLAAFAQPIQDMKNSVGDPMMVYEWRCGFNANTPEAELSAASSIRALLREKALEENSLIHTLNVQSREAQRESFYDLYGSLFFLGIMLSIVFLLAAVLIIYYKQISEGYEDRSRFEIMQKVGMTKRDIRKSINSQMLTIFFLPLCLAGIHLAFAFPFITKIFQMFAFDNRLLSITVNLGCFAAFGVFYRSVPRPIVQSRPSSTRAFPKSSTRLQPALRRQPALCIETFGKEILQP